MILTNVSNSSVFIADLSITLEKTETIDSDTLSADEISVLFQSASLRALITAGSIAAQKTRSHADGYCTPAVTTRILDDSIKIQSEVIASLPAVSLTGNYADLVNKPTTYSGLGLVDTPSTHAATLTLHAISGTSIIPYDDTTPLVTEGTQIASARFVPSSATGKLLMIGSLLVDCSSSNRNVTLTAFRDSVCIGATVLNTVAAGRPQQIQFLFTDLTLGLAFGSTAPIYSLRIGANASCTWYVNRMATPVFNGQTINDILLWEFN